jgi:hypothetical protein
MKRSPQRIGFVSDPIFQPSAFRRGWDALWGSARTPGLRLGRHAFGRPDCLLAHPPPLPQAAAQVPAITRVALETEVSKRVNDAVTKAVAESESRTQELLAASDKRHALETQAMVLQVQQYLEVEKEAS